MYKKFLPQLTPEKEKPMGGGMAVFFLSLVFIWAKFGPLFWAMSVRLFFAGFSLKKSFLFCGYLSFFPKDCFFPSNFYFFGSEKN